MDDIIRLLPDSVANQIAAGEVIQRPASVVKELVENAVDAGADDIQIIIKDAGRTLVQVADNGCGMSETDARMAFERHATSKISKADDLYTLHTMGFRGEALASIAAVAQIEMRTMRAGDTVGTRILINGSRVELQEPVASTVGTSIQVKNLFYTVPARRKFLKKDSVELGAIMREFERLALVNPGLGFTLWHNDQIVHQLLGSGVKKRICDLFGKNLDKQLIPVATDTSLVRISGFIGLPANARKRNALQYFLINGRNMRHPGFHKAILECYEELIPQDCQPNYFIYFEVDPETIDVNIHPTKNEIKFENEFGIRQILMASVKESLGKFSAMPGIDFDTDDAPDIPAFAPNDRGGHDVSLDSTYNPFDIAELESRESGFSSGAASPRPRQASPARPVAESEIFNRDWEQLYDQFTRNREVELESIGESKAFTSSSEAPSSPADDLQEMPSLDMGQAESPAGQGPAFFGAIQLPGGYVAAPCRSGMMIVDQHRAHVRVLYERYIEAAARSAASVQTVLFPETIELSVSENVLLDSIIDDVAALGFDLSPLGDNVWSINGIPATIGDRSPREVLARVISDAEAGIGGSETDSIAKRLALGMARATAVRSSQKLKPAEIEQLLSDLLKLPTPNFTPDGLSVIRIMDVREIDSMFAK